MKHDEVSPPSDEYDDLKNLLKNPLEELLATLDPTLAVGPQLDTIPGASGQFGYDESNPVPVYMVDGETEYLESLSCQCGQPLTFDRIGSLGDGPDGHIVDGYGLVCRSGQHQITLYMDMYHAGPSSRVPDGLAMGLR